MKKAFLSLKHSQRLMISNFCKYLPRVCKFFFEKGASIKSTGKIDYKKIYNYLYYYPGGTSNTNLLHWSALIARTDMDTFSSYEDVTNLVKTVNNDSFMKVLELKNYGHLDVLAPESPYKDIFIPIIKFLKE